MLAEDLSGFFLFTILLMVAVLLSIAEKEGEHLRRSTVKEHHPIDLRKFKTCPNCDDQLPLSTLVCEACDYNFLSGTFGPRHKLLPPPDPARVSV